MLLKHLTRFALTVLVALAMTMGFSGVTAANAASSTHQDSTSQARVTQKQLKKCPNRAHTVQRAQKKVNHLKRVVKHDKAKVKKAHTAKAKAKAKKALKRHTKALKKNKRWLKRSKAKLRACMAKPDKKPAPKPVTPSSPIQALCDGGVPQAVCDALGQVPLPSAPGGGGTDTPIDQLCAAAPQFQPLCDALGGGVPAPGGDNPLQPICSANAQLAPLCALPIPSGGLPTLPVLPPLI